MQTILLIALLWQLSGCSTLGSTYFKRFLLSEVACETPPPYAPGTLESVQWHAVAGIADRRYMALTGDDYKSLAKNGVIMEKALRQSHSRTVHYRGCIERHNAKRHEKADDKE